MQPQNRNDISFQNEVMDIVKEGGIEDTTGCIKPPKLPIWEKSLQELHLCVCGGVFPKSSSAFVCITSVMQWQTAMLSTSAVTVCTSVKPQTSYKFVTMQQVSTVWGFLLSFPHECLNDLESLCAFVPLCHSPVQAFGCLSQPQRKGKQQLSLSANGGRTGEW